MRLSDLQSRLESEQARRTFKVIRNQVTDCRTVYVEGTKQYEFKIDTVIRTFRALATDQNASDREFKSWYRIYELAVRMKSEGVK